MTPQEAWERFYSYNKENNHSVVNLSTADHQHFLELFDEAIKAKPSALEQAIREAEARGLERAAEMYEKHIGSDAAMLSGFLRNLRFEAQKVRGK